MIGIVSVGIPELTVRKWGEYRLNIEFFVDRFRTVLRKTNVAQQE